jgi:S-DNA-T family DNA segregation ATPase FtsK/SpoIIIE
MSSSDGNQFEDLVQRIAQIGRSKLVHLVLATQRPDATVIRGNIKANIDGRVVLRVNSRHDSTTAINQSGAEELLPYGDLLYAPGGGKPIRLQGYAPEDE